MSLFIWNDQDWKLVDIREKYDKTRYVIVRKLFVRWLKKPDVDMIAELRPHFEKYGDIKNFEVLTNVDNDPVAPDVFEAYVTFVKIKSAYQAFLAHRKFRKFPKEAIVVVPADCWRQEESSVPEEMTIELLNIMLAKLAIEKRTKLMAGIDMTYTVAQWRELASYVKEDIESVHFMFDPRSFQDNTNQNGLDPEEIENRLVQVIAHNCCGENLHNMSIHGAKSITHDFLNCMAPILKQITMLTITNRLENDCDALRKLVKYCPRLEFLFLNGDWKESAQEFDMQWPSLKTFQLEHLNIRVNRIDGEHGMPMRRFIESNPQFDSLLLGTIIDIDLVSKIVESSAKLDVLQFARESYDGFLEISDILMKAETLRALYVIFETITKPELDTTPILVERLAKMKNLRLVSFILNFQPNTDEVEDYVQRFRLPIVEHQNCKCHKSRMLTFDGMLPELQIEQDLPVAIIVVKTINLEKSNDTSLEPAIQNMLDATKKDYPHILCSATLNDDRCSVFVHIAGAYFNAE